MRVPHAQDCALLLRRERCSCGESEKRTARIIEETRKLDEKVAGRA